VAVSEQDDVLNRWRATRLVDTVSSIKSGAWGAEPASGGTLCIRIADFNTDNRAVVFKSRTMREIEKATLPGLLLKSGDLLVEKSGGGDKVPVGRIVMWQSDEKAITSNFISRIRLKSEYLPSYMSRVFQIQYVSGLSRKWLKQSTGIQNLDLANYLRETVPLPDLSEQILLSRYLDHAELQIAKAIQAKQKMVSLLNEQKQVIISELVTRGLNPDVPMKDSGQAWLGQIPAHWEVVRLGSVLEERTEMNDKEQVTQVLSLLRKRGVMLYEDKGRVGNKKSENIRRYKIVCENDIVVNCMNVIIGSVGLSSYVGCLSPVYYVLKARTESISSAYFNNVFQIEPFHKSLVRYGKGILAHRLRISMLDLKAVLVPKPPFSEQVEINEAISSRTVGIDGAIAAVEREIELLKEYRTVLISDVVTGKKDVRAEAADLPDVDPAELAQVLSGVARVDVEEDEDDDGTSEVE
jgi:type I restriction enzyme S subunit